ncbi:MAG: alanine racemase [Pseudohongiellaceae bacterium]
MAVTDKRRAWACIDLSALQANLALVEVLSPGRGKVAVIKADAYGHGIARVAMALQRQLGPRDYFAVASLDEAELLRELGVDRRLLLLPGFIDQDELDYVLSTGIEPVLHSPYQVDLLRRGLERAAPAVPVNVWLKLDSGMHRLGMSEDEFPVAFTELTAATGIGDVVMMSHLACADDETDPSGMTARQLARFERLHTKLSLEHGGDIPASVAASAGILRLPASHYQYLRPGIMLYGGSPLIGHTGFELGLRPVMTLRSRLLAIKDVQAGECIGYGATHTFDKNTRVGIVSIGYGDGYPRSAPNGTPVMVRDGSELRRTRMIGRVSMDMITIDLDETPHAEVGGEVVLWGEGLSVDEVATACGTISHELFCQLTGRMIFDYVG